MKRLLVSLQKMRRWKIKQYVTLFLIVGTLFAMGNYLLSSMNAVPTTVKTARNTRPTFQNAGRGGGAISHNCPYNADICRIVPGSTDAQTIENGVNQFSPSNISGDPGPAWLHHPVDNSMWLPNQSSHPWAWFFQTPLDPIEGDGSFTRDLWFAILGVADIYIFVLVLMNGFRILGGAVGFRYTEAIETLPRMILIIIVAHVSLLFVAFWIALANNLTQFIYITISTYAQQNDLVPYYPIIDNLQFVYNTSILGGDSNQIDILSLMEQALPKFIVWGLLQVIMVQVLIRLIGFLVAIIFGGPLVMMGASPFKKGKEAMQGWFMTIITTALATPVQVTFLLLGGVVAQFFYKGLHFVMYITIPRYRSYLIVPSDLHNSLQHALTNTDPKNIAMIALILWIEAAVMWGTINSVSLVRSSIASMGADAAQNLGSQAGGLAWAASSARFAYDQGWDQFRTGLI